MRTRFHSKRVTGIMALAVSVSISSCGNNQQIDPGAFAKEWTVHEAVNFTVLVPPKSPRKKSGIEALGRAADENYDFIARQLHLQLDEDLKIYLFTTSADCEKATGRAASFVDGFNIYTRIGAPLSGLIAEAMCNGIDPSANSFPLLRDGIRNYFELREQNVHYEAAALRASDRWPILEDLLYRQAYSDPEVYRFASASFVAFLIQRYGTDQFKMLWRSVLELRPSVEKIYGGTIPQMEEEWFKLQDRLAKQS